MPPSQQLPRDLYKISEEILFGSTLLSVICTGSLRGSVGEVEQPLPSPELESSGDLRHGGVLGMARR